MGLQFQSGKFAYYPNANFLDDCDSFSAAGWVRFDTVTTASKQYVFSFRGATNQISLRKESTSDNWKFSVTAGGVNVLNDIGPAIVQGQRYHVAVTWAKNATQKIYVDGTQLDSDSTTGHTVNFDSGGGTSFVWGAKTDTGVESGVCTLEGWVVLTGYVLSQSEISALKSAWWPHLAGVPTGQFFFPFTTGATAIKDWSGKARHITSATISASGVVDAPAFAPRLRPRRSIGLPIYTGGGGATPPAAWTKWGSEPLHPTASVQLTGLTNGSTYEIKVTAVDNSGNESADSAIVEAIPTDATVVHRPKRVFIGR